mmetsp:Transcript_37749/g.46767  ORF Transcript_37749/g.46767 Transcript_37749/m.46767 type:complete len:244 (+) Transcript_37749:65-796(+)
MLCCCGVEEPKKLELAAPENLGDEQKLSSVPITADSARRADGDLIEQTLPASVRVLGEDGRFEVRLDKSSGSYGFSLEYDFKDKVHIDAKDPCLLLSLHGGAAEQWNQKCPEQKLKVGDRIVAANGVSGASEGIFDAIKGSQEATLIIQRPKELKIPVKNCRSLGLDLAYADSAVGLIIKQVNQGPVKEWNASSTSQVSAGDRIVAVKSGYVGDGETTAATLLEELKSMEGEATLTVLSWPKI